MLALALAAWGAGAEPAWAIAGCDAFSAALRAGASDMGVEFSHAIVVSRTRSDANVFDVTTRVDVDGTLSCRGDEFLRFEARISEPANARTTTNFERFQAAALKAALGWDAAKSRGVLKGMSADAREYPRRLAPARRRLYRRQDRGARAGRRVARPDGDRFGPHLRHRRPGGPSRRERWARFRFHHLERRRVDQALPDLLERAYGEGRRVVVRAPSEEMVAALNDRLWTYDDASFLPHGAAGDGDPMTQPIFLTDRVENPNAATMLVLLAGRRDESRGRGVRPHRPPVRRARPGGDRRGAPRMEAAEGRGLCAQLLARGRRGRLGAGAVKGHKSPVRPRETRHSRAQNQSFQAFAAPFPVGGVASPSDPQRATTRRPKRQQKDRPSASRDRPSPRGGGARSCEWRRWTNGFNEIEQLRSPFRTSVLEQI